MIPFWLSLLMFMFTNPFKITTSRITSDKRCTGIRRRHLNASQPDSLEHAPQPHLLLLRRRSRRPEKRGRQRRAAPERRRESFLQDEQDQNKEQAETRRRGNGLWDRPNDLWRAGREFGHLTCRGT